MTIEETKKLILEGWTCKCCGKQLSCFDKFCPKCAVKYERIQAIGNYDVSYLGPSPEYIKRLVYGRKR